MSLDSFHNVTHKFLGDVGIGDFGGRNIGVATRAFAFLLLDDVAPNARSLAGAAFWLPPTPAEC